MLDDSAWVPRNRANGVYQLNGFARWLAARDGVDPADSDRLGRLLRDVTRADCEGYLEHRRAAEYSPFTVYNDWRYLKALFTWMADEGELSGERRSPMSKVAQPVVPKNPRTPVCTEDTYLALLASFPRGTTLGRRNAAMVSLMFRSGCRVGELGPINLEHYDEAAGLITLPETKTREVRRIPVHDETAKLIRRYLRSRGPTPGPLFLAGGRALSPRLRTQAIQTMFKKAAADVGLDVSPHNLRRGFAVGWMRKGGSVTGLQVVGGWKDQRMPLRYQGERREEVAAEEYQRLFGVQPSPVRGLVS